MLLSALLQVSLTWLAIRILVGLWLLGIPILALRVNRSMATQLSPRGTVGLVAAFAVTVVTLAESSSPAVRQTTAVR